MLAGHLQSIPQKGCRTRKCKADLVFLVYDVEIYDTVTSSEHGISKPHTQNPSEGFKSNVSTRHSSGHSTICLAKSACSMAFANHLN
jgi:hypothetical protein